jgi:hypothetical protein
VVGRGSVRTGRRGQPWETDEPTQMTRCGERNELFVNGSVFGDGSFTGFFWLCILPRFILGLTRPPRVAGKPRFGRNLSLPSLGVAQCSEQSFSSSFSFSNCSIGLNRSARVMPAARFGRSLSLPSLGVAQCSEQSFSSSFSFSNLLYRGQP